jgi:DNA-binding protein HU-beta
LIIALPPAGSAAGRNVQTPAIATATARLSGEQAKGAVGAVFDTIAAELAAGQDVEIAGFGKSSVAEHAAREAGNPATGETIQLAASHGTKFSAATGLKQQLAATRGPAPGYCCGRAAAEAALARGPAAWWKDESAGRGDPQRHAWSQPR